MLKDRPGQDRAASFRLYFISIPLGDAKFVTKEGRSAGQAPILINMFVIFHCTYIKFSGISVMFLNIGFMKRNIRM